MEPDPAADPPRLSLLGLPTELKVRIAELCAQQDANLKARIALCDGDASMEGHKYQLKASNTGRV
jgi:hypothetical protein